MLELDKWKCDTCKWVGQLSECLVAASPFDVKDTLLGCPKCKDVNTLFGVCDEVGCHIVSTCGWPTSNGYRRTCGEHMNHGG